MKRMEGMKATCAPRVILLGASNLTRGLPTVLCAARGALGHPLEVMAALGVGRSYGAWSSVLGRGLPGIAECGLWEALRRRPPAPAYALLTDIGNDILYGTPVPTIAEWVEGCLDRLGEAGASIVMTLLPATSIQALTPFRYHLLRRLFFPRSRLPLSEALERVKELNLRLHGLASLRRVQLAEPEASWYGLDSIHMKRRHWPVAWTGILGRWRTGDPAPLTGSSLRLWLELRLLRPERWSIAGFERKRAQPARTLRDGSTVSLY